MANKYELLFMEAFANYKHQEKRLGYTVNLFTKWRHSHELYPKLQAFQDALVTCDDEAAQAVIKSHMQKLSKNNHSFFMYFLDILEKNFPREEWDLLDPKPIVLYNVNRVYRGTDQTPDDVRNHGLRSLNTKTNITNIESYASSRNWDNGVSTSRKLSIAYHYADFNSLGGHYTCGWVYLVDAANLWGISICQTWAQRSWARKEDINMDEVNYLRPIPWQRIQQYHKVNFHPKSRLQWVENDEYDPNYMTPEYQQAHDMISTYWSHKITNTPNIKQEVSLRGINCCKLFTKAQDDVMTEISKGSTTSFKL